MASRMTSLTDPDTRMLRDGALEILDDHTIRLNAATPDISLIPGMADYPAAILHPSYPGGDPTESPLGTGPYLPEVEEVGARLVLVRNDGHDWWGSSVYGGPYLDRIEYVDLGTDTATHYAAAEAGEIDALYETAGEFVEVFDKLGWAKSEAITAATLAVRFNQSQPPFDNRDVRKALQMAVDNSIVLELGYAGLGTIAENHHVCPVHPEYAKLPPMEVNPAKARQAMIAAGHPDTEFELISLDSDWEAASCDAVAAQIVDAGIKINRRVLPGAVFWENWKDYPFSATAWNMRPLGVQVLALAYRSGAPWNESAFANEEFDALLAEAMSIADADRRRTVMAKLEKIMQDEGVMIQPYWRSLYQHFRKDVKGMEMHPSFEHHHYKWWIDG